MDEVLQWIAANAEVSIAEDETASLMASTHIFVGDEAYASVIVRDDGLTIYKFNVSMKAAKGLCAMIEAAIAENDSWRKRK